MDTTTVMEMAYQQAVNAYQQHTAACDRCRHGKYCGERVTLQQAVKDAQPF